MESLSCSYFHQIAYKTLFLGMTLGNICKWLAPNFRKPRWHSSHHVSVITCRPCVFTQGRNLLLIYNQFDNFEITFTYWQGYVMIHAPASSSSALSLNSERGISSTEIKVWQNMSWEVYACVFRGLQIKELSSFSDFISLFISLLLFLTIDISSDN